jgi:hypothetical protein
MQTRVKGSPDYSSKTPEEIARALDVDPEDVFHILRHLKANPDSPSDGFGGHR